MARTIVLGYDGSDCARAALDETLALAADSRDPLVVLVYCHEPPPGLSCPLDPRSAAAKELRDYERRIEHEVEPMLAEAAGRLRDAGVETEVVLLWDDPARALQAVARERGSRLVVVGSHCRGPLAGALGRHLAAELLHRGEVPVLVVPRRR